MNEEPPQFEEFPKMARLSREVIITEKIDGTNGQILITDDGQMFVGSRTRWLSLKEDNFSFYRWAMEQKETLLKLGPGRHFGEWWGAGIQRNYGLSEKRFSLFNVSRWCLPGSTLKRIPNNDPRIEKYQDVLPEGIGLVPEMWRGVFSTLYCELTIDRLKKFGSLAKPGFMNPEGIVIYHVAAGIGFKKTLEKDETPKSRQ